MPHEGRLIVYVVLKQLHGHVEKVGCKLARIKRVLTSFWIEETISL
jgi:hypothetical protein